MGELSAGASVAVGVIVGLLSTSVQSIGLTLQRKSHLLEDEKEEHHMRRPPYKRRRWQLGMLMFIIANLVGSTIQITTLPLPVLSTLQASGLVFNSVCATLILSEPFTRYSLIGTVLVAAGALLIGTFGALTEPSHSLDQLLLLLDRRQFLLWLGSTLFLVILILIAAWFLNQVAPGRYSARIRLLRGMSFGCISGILSAHSLLVAKSAVELLVRTVVDRHNQFNRFQAWLILLDLVFFALSQLYYLHRGLKLCSTSVLYPFVFCIYNIVAILDGLIYFNQGARLPISHAALIAVGTLILLSGVLALSWRLDHTDSEDDGGLPHTVEDSMFHGRALRIATPQTALTPGMSLVPSEPFDEDDNDSAAYAHDSPVCNEEIGSDHPLELADENTPLLRTSTTPGAALSRKRKRTLRQRRMTIPEEASEIWDELLDRGDQRRPSMSLSGSGILKSTRPAQGEGSMTVAAKSRRPHSADHHTLAQRQALSPPSRPSQVSFEQAESIGGEEALEEQDGVNLGRPSARSKRGGTNDDPDQSTQASTGDWFWMKWWKRRWREEGEADRDTERGQSTATQR